MTVEKHFSSSILLWMRDDQPRQAGMDHWKGPHSGIIAATPGLLEYRQIHLDEENPGRWPAVDDVETAIPADRKVDGVAEVTFRSPLSPLLGRTQTKLAYADEVNVFRRTLLYAGPPGSSQWHDVVGAPGEGTARALVHLRRRDGAAGFSRFVRDELAAALIESTPLTELRVTTFLPWSKLLWDTPGVAHDNPRDHQLHASLILGFPDGGAREAFYADAGRLSVLLAPHVEAVHAYDVASTLTFVRGGAILPEPREC